MFPTTFQTTFDSQKVNVLISPNSIFRCCRTRQIIVSFKATTNALQWFKNQPECLANAQCVVWLGIVKHSIKISYEFGHN